MNDIAAFLRARLDEREQRAKDWTDAEQPYEEHDAGECPTCDRRRRAIVNMLDHDEIDEPEFVLADVAAKRQMLKVWPDNFAQWSASEANAARAVKDRMLRLLALPYADHPDYREEWKP